MYSWYEVALVALTVMVALLPEQIFPLSLAVISVIDGIGLTVTVKSALAGVVQTPFVALA